MGPDGSKLRTKSSLVGSTEASIPGSGGGRNMNLFSWRFKNSSNSLVNSTLFDENSFYKAFVRDLNHCQEEVIIESPFITASRMELLYPMFEELLSKGISVTILTRDPIEHEEEYLRNQATNEILHSIELGINIILLKGYHHRKLAFLDRRILWEGSLNILSQGKSKEIMRRIEGKEIVKQMFKFLKLGKLLNG